MSHYVGLDASKQKTSICILDDEGNVVHEGETETDPHALVHFLRGDRRRYRRIGIESISFTPWLYEALAKAGLPIICVESRHAHGYLNTRLNKTDRNDARGLAELMRAGIYKTVHIKTRQSQEAKLVLAARKRLLSKCRDIDNFIRASLLQHGFKLRAGQHYSFAVRAADLAPLGSALRDVVGALLSVRRVVDTQVKAFEAKIVDLAKSDAACQRFMTAPGVGPLTALSFRAAVDVAERFSSSRDVAVHLGLTPRTFRSGTIDRKAGISRCGDESARTSLFIAAQSILRTRTRPSRLKTWGLSVVASRGYKKGVVAVARRLAVILHQMWVTGTDFRAGVETDTSVTAS